MGYSSSLVPQDFTFISPRFLGKLYCGGTDRKINRQIRKKSLSIWSSSVEKLTNIFLHS